VLQGLNGSPLAAERRLQLLERLLERLALARLALEPHIHVALLHVLYALVVVQLHQGFAELQHLGLQTLGP